jgi:hypothetical protein
MDTISGLLSPRKERVLACVQDGHCHDAAVLKEAADMDAEEERHWLPSLALKKREASASFLTMASCFCCCCASEM